MILGRLYMRMNLMPTKNYYKSTLDLRPTFEKPKRTFYIHKDMNDVCNFWQSKKTNKRIYVYLNNIHSEKNQFEEVHSVYTLQKGLLKPVDKPSYLSKKQRGNVNGK